jgi:tol-pal system protein YbgF
VDNIKVNARAPSNRKKNQKKYLPRKKIITLLLTLATLIPVSYTYTQENTELQESKPQTQNNTKTNNTQTLEELQAHIERIEDNFLSLKNEVDTLRQQSISRHEKLLRRLDQMIGKVEELREQLSESIASPPQDKSLENTPPKEKTSSTNNTSSLPPQQLYENAYQMLANKEFSKAREVMSNFLSLYPQHELADNAAYWIGETLFAEKLYEKAAQQFSVAFETYPKGNKAPDSLLKLAITLTQLNKKNEACVTLNALIKRYPQAPKHITERTKSEISKLSCPS